MEKQQNISHVESQQNKYFIYTDKQTTKTLIVQCVRNTGNIYSLPRNVF